MSVLVGRKAPDFTATTVMPDNSIQDAFTLSTHLKGKKGVLFFYPLDFTFVCPSEIIAFHRRLKEFEVRNTKVVAVSVDSHFSHLAWKNVATAQGGIGNVQFPMVSDLTKSISRNYDVLINDAISLRGTFLIDEEFTVRHQLVNDLPLGRNVDETLRTLDALIFNQEHGEVCPAGWQKGEDAMTPTPEGVAAYLAKNASTL